MLVVVGLLGRRPELFLTAESRHASRWDSEQVTANRSRRDGGKSPTCTTAGWPARWRCRGRVRRHDTPTAFTLPRRTQPGLSPVPSRYGNRPQHLSAETGSCPTARRSSQLGAGRVRDLWAGTEGALYSHGPATKCNQIRSRQMRRWLTVSSPQLPGPTGAHPAWSARHRHVARAVAGQPCICPPHGATG